MSTIDPQTQNPGYAPPDRIPTRRKSPALAGILSMMPGLGQVYIGFYRRGFIQMLTVAATIAALSSGAGSGGLEPLFGMFLSFFWLYNVIDAIRMANFYNEAMAGVAPEDLRKELAGAGKSGSVGGGVLLIAFGLLFFLHQQFDMPLDWLKDWWPVVPIGFGAYLLYGGLKDRGKKD